MSQNKFDDDTPNGRKLKVHEVKQGDGSGSSLMEKLVDGVKGKAKSIFAQIAKRPKRIIGNIFNRQNPQTVHVQEVAPRIIKANSPDGRSNSSRGLKAEAGKMPNGLNRNQQSDWRRKNGLGR